MFGGCWDPHIVLGDEELGGMAVVCKEPLRVVVE